MTRITITAPDALAEAVAFLASAHGYSVSAMWRRLATEHHSGVVNGLRLVAVAHAEAATRKRASVLLAQQLDTST